MSKPLYCVNESSAVLTPSFLHISLSVYVCVRASVDIHLYRASARFRFASPGVDIGRLDGVEEELSHSDTLHVDEVGLEQSLRGLESLSSHLDHTTIWQLDMCRRDEMKREGEKKKI